jgi:predicted O-methyltransferase YrrM
MTDEEFVRSCFERFLRRPAEKEGLDYYLQRLHEGADRLDVVQGIVVGEEFLALLMRQAFGTHVGTPVLAFAPPGHYYSPIPSKKDVERFALEKWHQGPEAIAGVDFNVAGQLRMLETLGPLTRDLVFADDPGGATRYWWDNDGFSPGDATVLAAMLMHYRPRRVLEIGAGYSTAVMLDVVERHLAAAPPQITCVDPEPGRLRSVLRGDEANLTIHEAIMQDLPRDAFTSLAAGDILFIDSSHVLKLGSDVSILFLEVLPRLAPGVVVHVHDIATSFEYPLEWYEEGRAWNEAPALRAFLAFNQAYEILYFCDYMNRFQEEAVARHMPLALRHPKGAPEGNTSVSFWMRRR